MRINGNTTLSEIQHSDELYHFGILGMKWGIRRYQNKDGSLTAAGKARLAERNVRTEENLGEKTIPKGTKMYRVTPHEKDAQGEKTAYVTYTDTDRALYRSGSDVKRYANISDPNAPVYEHQFELTKDIKIPSLKKVREIEQRVLEDNKRRQEVGEAYIKENLMTEYYTPDDVFKMTKIARMMEKNGGSSRELYSKVMKMYKDEWQADDHYYNALSMYRAKDDFDKSDFLQIERALGMACDTKNAIINELKKEGYNAMYDNASIGVKSDGKFSRLQEGVEPLIVFDAKSTLRESNVVKVDRDEQSRAKEIYDERIKAIRDEVRDFKD